MDARNKKKLTKNFVRLVAETPVKTVVDYLRQSLILNDELTEDIMYQNTEKKITKTVNDTDEKRTQIVFHLRCRKDLVDC